MRSAKYVSLLALAIAGCATTPSLGAKAQEVATELNVNARFGRLEMAVDHVVKKEREAFMERHKAWGGSIRIADTEMAGVKADEKEAVAYVKYAWYRPDEQELHVTTIKQTYKDVDGEYQLASEQRVDGEPGLLGEPIAPKAAKREDEEKPRPPARFPVVRIPDSEGSVYRSE